MFAYRMTIGKTVHLPTGGFFHSSLRHPFSLPPAHRWQRSALSCSLLSDGDACFGGAQPSVTRANTATLQQIEAWPPGERLAQELFNNPRDSQPCIRDTFYQYHKHKQGIQTMGAIRQLVRPRRESFQLMNSSIWWAGVLLSLSVTSAFQPLATVRSPGCNSGGHVTFNTGFHLPPHPLRAVTDPEVLMAQAYGDDDGWTVADRNRIEMLYALAAAEKEDIEPPKSTQTTRSLGQTRPKRTMVSVRKESTAIKLPSTRTRQPRTVAGSGPTRGERVQPTRSKRVQFRGLSTTSNKARYRRTPGESSLRNTKPVSTMPGFMAESGRQRAHRESLRLTEKRTGRKVTESAATRKKRRRENGEAMYRNSASVPDSLVQFADEIHQEDRITRMEEIELGEKTQEAIRLHNLYNTLEETLAREPTDQEWCAAAGKINMEAIRQTIEEGLEAKNKLVTSNLRLVQSVVNTYIRNGLAANFNAGDMMQDGIVALIRAAEKFEPDRGWRFSTYAMYWVRASVKRSQVAQSRVINVPHRLHETHKRLMKIEHELSSTLDRKPTLQELATAANLSEQQVERCLAAVAQRCFSLDQEITNTLKPNSVSGRNDRLVDILDTKSEDTDEKKLSSLLIREDIIETLHRQLSPEEAELVLFRYGLKELPEDATTRIGGQPTIAELSRFVGLKPDKVRRIINRSLKQLRSSSTDEWQSFQRDLL